MIDENPRASAKTVPSGHLSPIGTAFPRLNAALANAHCHVGGVWTLAIVAEWLARCKSRVHVERAGRHKRFVIPSLQAHMFEAPLLGNGEEMVKHRAANAHAADMLRRMHRLQLRVLIAMLLERADRDQLPATADTEEGDGGIKQVINLERVHILWRAVQTPKLQMMLDELPHVIESWIGNRDVELIHRHAILTPRFPPRSTRAPVPVGPQLFVSLGESLVWHRRSSAGRSHRMESVAMSPVPHQGLSTLPWKP